MDDGAIKKLREFVYDRWAIIQPQLFPDVIELRERLDDVTPSEATWFLEALVPHRGESTLFGVEDNNKYPSPLYPPNTDGGRRGNVFFERPLNSENWCTLRLETIVHQAAVWRLHDEFKWPLSHLIVESPDVGEDGSPVVLTREALDILVLQHERRSIPSRVTPADARSTLGVDIGVEVKADRNLLDRLLEGMLDCRGASGGQHRSTDHKKCLGLDYFRPRLFLGVAAAEDWRLFNVDERDGRAVLGAQRDDLGELHFDR